MCSKLDKLEKNDEKLIQMSSNLNQTIIKVDKIGHDIGRQKLYMKQLAYHTIDQSARSRRNNLIFYGLADLPNENIYTVMVDFMSDQLDINLTEICVQRIHRLGSISRARARTQTPRRPVIIAFRDYRDTEYIMENVQNLYGTRFGIDRDYPKEIAVARKKLYDFQRMNFSKKDKCKIQYPAK
ncbi:uncharacterized protein LOC132753837 [Ruditapes philippinarum]|uniref:uncharacterized protein LOC132753837 n=1 Tax=Ruditapes philippinarum TaxID=129788 RepID=UPI00295B2AFB|nr:uncharacterized protein LOC132753837 [Ruditapes philippinarum]